MPVCVWVLTGHFWAVAVAVRPNRLRVDLLRDHTL